MSIEQYMHISRSIDPETMQWVYKVQTSAFTELLNTSRKHHMFVRGTQPQVFDADAQQTDKWEANWRRITLAGHSDWVDPQVQSQLDIAVSHWEQTLRDPASPWYSFLSDVLVTAVEGGIDYWGDDFGARYDHPKMSTTPKDMPERACITEAQDESTGCYGYATRNPDSCPGHTIDFDVLERGIALMRIVSPLNYTSHHVQSSVAENDACMIDSDGADLIVQFGLFGEIVYG